MVKNHSYRERGNPLPPHGLLFLYASSHSQDNTYHGLCYIRRGALAGMRNSPMGPPWRIDPTTHCTMSERSYQWSYISLVDWNKRHRSDDQLHLEQTLYHSWLSDNINAFINQWLMLWSSEWYTVFESNVYGYLSLARLNLCMSTRVHVETLCITYGNFKWKYAWK